MFVSVSVHAHLDFVHIHSKAAIGKHKSGYSRLLPQVIIRTIYTLKHLNHFTMLYDCNNMIKPSWLDLCFASILLIKKWIILALHIHLIIQVKWTYCTQVSRLLTSRFDKYQSVIKPTIVLLSFSILVIRVYVAIIVICALVLIQSFVSLVLTIVYVCIKHPRKRFGIAGSVSSFLSGMQSFIKFWS